MALDPVNGSKNASRPPAKSARSGLASLQRMWEEVQLEDAQAASQATSLSQKVPTSQDETPFPGWDPSPERRPRSNGKMSTGEFWSSLESMKSTLETGAANVVNSRAKFDAKISNAAPKRKRIEDAESSVPSRPVKRRSEVTQLSDSESEPIVKRRQPTSVPPPAPPKVMPWNQDHSKKKLAPAADTSITKKPKPKAAEIVSLSLQQQAILEVVMEGKNVFFTGSAGTGKSVLLRSIIKSMRAKYVKSPDAVAVTASTGIAACNIGGITLHSFGGIGLGTENATDLAKKIKRNQKATTRWNRTKVLIIDEISMLDGDLFDKLAQIAQILRRNPKPFGGIQLVLTGDFFQLPPVTRGAVTFAFNAKCWQTCMEKTFNLTRVFRQKDQDFVDMLNEMRFGRLSPRSIQAFAARSRPLPVDGIEPTELFPRREDVDRANKERMDRLEGHSFGYNATDSGTADERSRENMLNNFMAPKSLILKVNAQVMMIKNVDDQLVNGTVGKVVDFMTESEWTDSLLASGRQPDENPDEKDKPRKPSTGKKLPVVEWKIVGSRNPRVELVRDETFKVEGPNNKIEASRTQLPLILAWAMSIHKSQGQTLEKVRIDLSKVFEKGQAYVAISRATSLEGLQIIGFQASKVYAHPAVIEWSKTLTN